MPAREKISKSNKNTLTKLNSFRQVFAEFLALPHLSALIIFVLIYNLAETQLVKIVPLFLLDKISDGGLGFTIEQVGAVYGGIGTIGMLTGILISGFLLSKVNLKQALAPVTLLVALTNFVYLLLCIFKITSIALIGLSIAIAQIGYGLSNGIYMLYLLNTFTKGHYPMSLYAIGTALMGLGVLAGGAISGYIEEWLGYPGFFGWIIGLSFCIVFIAVYNVKKVL